VLADPTEVECPQTRPVEYELFHRVRLPFVIHLNLGSHPPKFLDAEGREVVLSVSPGKKAIDRGVWYKGKVPVNLIGVWQKGYAESLSAWLWLPSWPSFISLSQLMSETPMGARMILSCRSFPASGEA
jgi:hypothetical protein